MRDPVVEGWNFRHTVFLPKESSKGMNRALIQACFNFILQFKSLRKYTIEKSIYVYWTMLSKAGKSTSFKIQMNQLSVVFFGSSMVQIISETVFTIGI